MSLNRFRNKKTSIFSRNPKHKPLFEISLPEAPKPTQARSVYKHSRVTASPTTSFEDIDDDIIPLTASSISSHSSKSSSSSLVSGSGSLSLPVSRNNSFKMKTLDPHRLSLRLKSSTSANRSDSPLSSSHEPNNKTSVNRAHTDPLPLPSSSSSASGRSEFIYKPICPRDYTAVVAETATSTGQSQCRSEPTPSSSRYQYNYISSGPGRGKQGLPSGPAPRPRARARAQAHYALEDEEDDIYNDFDEGYGASRPREHSVSSPNMCSSAAEKKRVRAARRMTTVMVPDAEDIYG